VCRFARLCGLGDGASQTGVETSAVISLLSNIGEAFPEAFVAKVLYESKIYHHQVLEVRICLAVKCLAFLTSNTWN